MHPHRTSSASGSLSLPRMSGKCPASAAHGLLDTGLVDTESSFYRSYPWCINAFPPLREVAQHLREELSRLEELDEGWQRAEVLTNVFLLSCAIADTVDDYMLGERFDFSQATAVAPAVGRILRAGEVLLKTYQRAREGRLGRVRRWREAWGAGVEEFLKLLVARGGPDQPPLSDAGTRLASLSADLPLAVLEHRPRIPAAFRQLDLTHFDVLALGRQFITAFPNRERPILVVGLRTIGSYFAPLLCAWLAVEGYRTESVTIRPAVGLSARERERLAHHARKGSLAVIVDEVPTTGGTLAKGIDLARKNGFATDDVVSLLPIHPTRRDWVSHPAALPLSGIRILSLDPEHWHKRQLLEPKAVETRLREYLGRRTDATIHVLDSPTAERLNLTLQRYSEEKYHNRLKRIYEVRLDDEQGRTETRYVLAKSVGWGWFGYHAAVAGERLSAFVPPILGLRDGILYTEWVPQAEPAQADRDRGRWIEVAASYVAARVRRLTLDRDPSPDLSRANQDKGVDLLARTLARAYGWKPATVLKRARLRHELARRVSPCPTLIDAKMRPQEWITGPGSLLKTDFEHHGQGRHELNVADPAYDLAETILSWGLSEAEEEGFIEHYIEASGDAGVRDRLFVNKLLAGTSATSAALANLADGRLSDRAEEWNRLYNDGQTFLTVHTARFCGRLCGRPAMLHWHSPLVVMDIDGVLDKGIFGFPSTTAAGLRALSLLHAHDTAVAVNTARTLSDVQEYCRAYGFVGGVAEYGAVAWDEVDGRERILVSAEPLHELEKVRTALRQMAGVFLNEDYQYSIRAYTYERGTTVPLPTFLIRDLLAELKADRLDFHQTFVDTAIVAKDVDKGTGLLALLELVGHRDIEPIAIGDSEADLAMFRVAHRSFAPSHFSTPAVARLLGCRIASRPYQAGLLSSVRTILHPDGSRCDRCGFGDHGELEEADPLFAKLLVAADQGQVRSLLQALLDPMCLRAFAR